MRNLSNEELQTNYNKLRAELLRKKGNEKNTPKHLISSLYLELREIDLRMSEIKTEAQSRGLEIN